MKNAASDIPCFSQLYCSSGYGPLWTVFVVMILIRWKETKRITVEGFRTFLSICKVEKILKGSLDSIPSPSPSVEIQIMGGKVCLRCKVKILLGIDYKLLKTKSVLRSPSNVLPCFLFLTEEIQYHDGL